MVRRSRDDAVATRGRILASAQQLMRQRGVHCVTLEDVARAIGMTRGAVYAHFRSRAALMGALLSCAEADLADRLAPLAARHHAGAATDMLEPALAALLDDDGMARHVSLLAFLLQHKCGTACELCPLRARVLRGADTLRNALAVRMAEPAQAGLLVAHLWGLLSAHALQLAPSGLSGCAASLARLYAAPGMQRGAWHGAGAPAFPRDTP
ncbi:TetR/AcrR family transcriptional regulator [Cupriavidus oxalaticus]|jgi:TetR/AcrR family acrAB operon transcriptional repressor|uniref:TetR family transcriptional regulator n=1 Tax=Cupriavidus oxalaticus TaxID=96344 RepID=A0A976GBR2_9BURK|nr:TetR/AcrR family transcriptional regulator [Cupriavidus oxalaticus]QRQ84102.1 TetR family transcriptional regulator [Cupriavidus oxalaticus]QRQ91809.1 TetR family transcriptional regulator [Cupriavidus oxalaticus]WQD86399.1 TetR family transcriptional regulator [Cupriavidus oxalaticus]SPC17736.1 Transcriptional regulator, TetR/AcrR-family [Cupriavidus oxalaticus]